MMYQNKNIKRIIILLFLTILTFNLFTEKKVYSDDSNSKVLVMYDEYKEYGEKENILNKVNKLALLTQRKVDIVKLSNYNGENLSSYETLFILCTKENSINNYIENEIDKYPGKIYWFGKNFNNTIKRENIKYIDDLKLTDENYLKLIKIISDDFNLKNNNVYFYFDDVKPVADLNDLVDKIDYLKKYGISFFIKVPPVFLNENLDAMRRFTEVLRYAQASGGQIVLGFPEVIYESSNEDEVVFNIKKGYENYVNYWVYPVSIDADDFTLYKEKYKTILESSNTIFLEPDSDKIGVLELSNYSEGPYNNVIQKVNLNFEELNYKDLNLKNSAVKVSNRLSLEEFEKKVDYLINRNLIFSNTRNLNCTININDKKILSNNKGIFLNDELVTQTKFINNKEYEKIVNKDKTFNEVTNESIDLTNTNNILIEIVVITSIVFLIIILISRRINRRKFFK